MNTISEKLVEVSEKLYNRVKGRILIQGERSHFLYLEVGVKQGDGFSPLIDKWDTIEQDNCYIYKEFVNRVCCTQNTVLIMNANNKVSKNKNWYKLQ